MRHLLAVAVFVAASVPALAQTTTAPPPEECIVGPGQRAAASATYNGRTYTFRRVECRDVFLSDPERFAQLYDALIELAAAGTPLEAPPKDASLVPS